MALLDAVAMATEVFVSASSQTLTLEERIELPNGNRSEACKLPKG